MAWTKKTKILYWVLTTPFLLLMLFSAYTYFFAMTPEMSAGLTHMGYPLFLLKILGTAKFLGVLAIVYDRQRTLKEWAYAGFTFNLLGASASHYFAGDDFSKIVAPLLFWGLLMTSYFLWHKKFK